MDALNPTTHQALDATLPPELQNVVRFGVPVADKQQTSAAPGEAGSSATAAVSPDSHSTVEDDMDKDTVKIDEQALASAVEKVVKDVLGASNREAAMASKIESLVRAEMTATASANEAGTKLTAANKEIEGLRLKVTEAEAAKQAFDKFKKDAEDEKDKSKQAMQKCKADLDEANKKIADLAAEKITASRTAALASVNIEAKDHRALARNEQGAFKMGDEDFTAYIADMKAVAEKAKASATQPPTPPAQPQQPAQATQQQPAAPVAPVQATATQQPAAPAAPDLSQAGVYQQALAALVAASATPNASGRKAFAQAFPAE